MPGVAEIKPYGLPMFVDKFPQSTDMSEIVFGADEDAAISL
jgi:hypothetical protein